MSAHSPFDFQRIGEGRVRIRGGDPGEAASEALMAWLAARAEVREIRHREATGTIDVRFEEEDGTKGAFARALRDRIYALEMPVPEAFGAEVTHALAGRTRLRMTGATGDEIERLSLWLASVPGVTRASASPASESVLVYFDADVTSASKLRAAIAATEPRTWPALPERVHPPTGWRTAAFNTAVFAATVSGVAPPPAVAAAIALTALPSVRRAIRAAKEKRLSVDLLDLAAIGISLATGQPTTAAFITWLLGVGDLVLERTSDRARSAISKLMKLDATEAFRLRSDHSVEKVSVKKLAVGDRLIVDAGGAIAADGVVVSGFALVDEKALTGESFPRERRAGDRVLAATVVVEGQIILEVDRAGVDTTAMKIVQILEGAGAKPMSLQRETERVADKLVLPTFGVAGAAALLTSQIDRMTSVLITDFGTGIRIAVPTAALTAMTMAARAGVLVKGGQYLERLSKVDAIVFDKTGTLTGGEPQIFEVAALGRRSGRDCVSFAAAAEARQGHPIAEAIRRHAERWDCDMLDAEVGSEVYTIGIGLAARVGGAEVLVGGKRWMLQRGVRIAHARAWTDEHREAGASSLFVAIDGALEAIIGFADEPREESRASCRRSRRMEGAK